MKKKAKAIIEEYLDIRDMKVSKPPGCQFSVNLAGSLLLLQLKNGYSSPEFSTCFYFIFLTFPSLEFETHTPPPKKKINK